MDKDREKNSENAPEGFTLTLAVLDIFPVLEFCAAVIIIAIGFKSAIFAAGAGLCALAGCGKAAWKLIIALGKKNITFLTNQFKYLMSLGLILIIVSIIVNFGSIDFTAILGRIGSFPAIFFFALGLCGICAMGVMGSKLDRLNARHNLIEECVNIFAQGMILLGVIFC